MNKKITVIELFNRIYEKRNIPKKIVCMGTIYNWDSGRYLHYEDEQEPEKSFLEGISIEMVLDVYVGILEDNTEEIEELDTDIHIDSFMDAELSFNKIAQEINKLGKAVNELRKEKE